MKLGMYMLFGNPQHQIQNVRPIGPVVLDIWSSQTLRVSAKTGMVANLWTLISQERVAQFFTCADVEWLNEHTRGKKIKVNLMENAWSNLGQLSSTLPSIQRDRDVREREEQTNKKERETANSQSNQKTLLVIRGWCMRQKPTQKSETVHN